MIKKILATTFLLFIILIRQSLYAGEQDQNIKISGYLISDYYTIHESDKNVASNYKPKMLRQVYSDGRSGFQFRRIYLTFDKKIDLDFSARLRFEMNNTDYYYSKMTPAVKDAYLKWSYSLNHNVIFGISGSPNFEVIEKFWGYRWLEKTACDYFEIRSSRDFGVALKGKLLNNMNYHLFFGNGESNASEKTGTNDKLTSLSLSQTIAEHFIYQFYSDYRLSKKGGNDEFTGQTFIGYQNDKIRFGFQYTYQENKLMKSEKKGNINLYSLPVIFNYTDLISFIFRYSYYSVEEEQNYKQQAILLGFDYKLRKNISIMPNILYNDYNFETTNTIGKDVISRITLSYKIN